MTSSSGRANVSIASPSSFTPPPVSPFTTSLAKYRLLSSFVRPARAGPLARREIRSGSTKYPASSRNSFATASSGVSSPSLSPTSPAGSSTTSAPRGDSVLLHNQDFLLPGHGNDRDALGRIRPAYVFPVRLLANMYPNEPKLVATVSARC